MTVLFVCLSLTLHCSRLSPNKADMYSFYLDAPSATVSPLLLGAVVTFRRSSLSVVGRRVLRCLAVNGWRDRWNPAGNWRSLTAWDLLVASFDCWNIEKTTSVNVDQHASHYFRNQLSACSLLTASLSSCLTSSWSLHITLSLSLCSLSLFITHSVFHSTLRTH